MKKFLLYFTIILFPQTAWSQDNFTLSGGYALANPEDYSTEATGFRITGTYEVGSLEKKKLVHGFAFGYVLTAASVTIFDQNLDITIRTLPMYYAPKFLFGGDKVLAFVRGALGMQFARFKLDSQDYNEYDRDWGFYGGVGFGGMVNLSEKIFINAEYEWAYQSHTYYKNGMLNSIQMGFGFKL